MTEKMFTKRQRIFVEFAFSSDTGCEWLNENGDDPRGEMTDEELRDWLEVKAREIYDQAVIDYEDEFDEGLDMTFEQFLQVSDFEAAYEHIIEQRDTRHESWQDEATLNEVMTAAEVMEEYDLSESTVRQALNRESLRGRKSGETWLVLRKDAAARWGKKA